jgi:uncharacterized membrane protein
MDTVDREKNVEYVDRDNSRRTTQSATWPDSPKNTTVNVSDPERAASIAMGGLLVLRGLFGSKGIFRLGYLLGGGNLIVRGVQGQCTVYKSLGINTAKKTGNSSATVNASKSINVKQTVTIDKPTDELFRFWRNFENLPKFMQHLKDVKMQGETKSHWVANAPLGATVEWDAEIFTEKENEMIAWKSLPGSQIMNAGTVQFRELSEGRGTEVKVELNYEPPAGGFGAAIAKLLGEDPEQQVREDLRHFKNLMEAGEIPTTKGQPACR